MSRTAPQSALAVLFQPLLLATLALAGLILGLTGDGWRDWLAVVLVALPLIFFLLHWRRRRHTALPRKTQR